MPVPVVAHDLQRTNAIARAVLEFVDQHRREPLGQEEQGVAGTDHRAGFSVTRAIPATGRGGLHRHQIRRPLAIPVVFAEESLPAQTPRPLRSVEVIEDVAVGTPRVVAGAEMIGQPFQALFQFHVDHGSRTTGGSPIGIHAHIGAEHLFADGQRRDTRDGHAAEASLTALVVVANRGSGIGPTAVVVLAARPVVAIALPRFAADNGAGFDRLAQTEDGELSVTVVSPHQIATTSQTVTPGTGITLRHLPRFEALGQMADSCPIRRAILGGRQGHDRQCDLIGFGVFLRFVSPQVLQAAFHRHVLRRHPRVDQSQQHQAGHPRRFVLLAVGPRSMLRLLTDEEFLAALDRLFDGCSRQVRRPSETHVPTEHGGQHQPTDDHDFEATIHSISPDVNRRMGTPARPAFTSMNFWCAAHLAWRPRPRYKPKGVCKLRRTSPN